MIYTQSCPGKMHLLKLPQDRVALSPVRVVAHYIDTTSVLFCSLHFIYTEIRLKFLACI